MDHSQHNMKTNDNHQDHSGGHDKHKGHSPKMFLDRLVLSSLVTIPILYFSSQFQAWFNYKAVSFPLQSWINPILATIIFIYGGMPFLKGALRELKNKKPAMMTLISIAISVAYFFSLAVSFGFPGKPFYWELASLIVIMLLGHWIEMTSVQNASQAVAELSKLMPTIAHLMKNGKIEDVAISELKIDDNILIRPGEQVPADGLVIEGSSSLNEAFLTGESRPVVKKINDEVVAGSINGEAALTVKINRIGENTTLSQIKRLIEEAQASRSQFENLADRAAAWLTYIAIAVGLITLITWLIVGKDFNFAVTLMVTVLVIACPHALGLAIPLVTANATAVSANNGILVRNREAFERARDIKTVAFDKTGTLTEGEFGIRELYSDALDEAKIYDLALGLETKSEHPLAQAVVKEANKRQSRAASISDFKVVAGKGISAIIDNQTYRMGRPEWPSELNIDFSDKLKANLQEAESRGESVIALMDEKQVLALFALADKVRQSARETINSLLKMGIEPVMITGDAEAVAKTVANDLGIKCYYARVLPDQKATIIKELKSKNPTAFVGDGINDAPALLEANLGIAIGAGTNVAIESADLVLVENDPLDIIRALKLAKATYNKMRQNLFWATGYNLLAIPLAAGVLAPIGFFLSPAIGAIFMSLSTVIVAINAMSLRRVNLA
ncbi:MAG TPA: copper-translocating P-type ATPase [Trueperaceae bacterium]|nr:copper-translocating P-type ATPase [Trueperaceae bacterium]